MYNGITWQGAIQWLTFTYGAPNNFVTFSTPAPIQYSAPVITDDIDWYNQHPDLDPRNQPDTTDRAPRTKPDKGYKTPKDPNDPFGNNPHNKRDPYNKNPREHRPGYGQYRPGYVINIGKKTDKDKFIYRRR